ncbi:MAG TPA: adenylyl-sulfate reductase subunit alpha, partial [Ruminococcaceae bacterium]|nr:adenylyl-sulfate reductase subunit alpha [Oscillospiraceae bacterium]
AERLNAVTRKMETLGLVILKNADGKYEMRGKRNVKINGENIKPLLAKAVAAHPNIQILNHINITDYLCVDNKVEGAVGFSIKEPVLYTFYAKATLCATGGASGLYRPNNPGFSRHKMWYCPFDTGAGYAMGIRAGAEMTTFEMRFIALRCKDTIAPTGTIAQGVGAPQVNGLGEPYADQYGGNTTALRLYSTVMENLAGRGPCYLKTKGITDEQQDDLYKAYLNMAPAQTLRWMENGGPASHNVEIEGTEPYVVGGHTASGYWVNTNRETTLSGLFAAGDVAGGCPQKYVTGAFAESEIAAQAVCEYLEKERLQLNFAGIQKKADTKLAEINAHLGETAGPYSVLQLEEAMQKTMDEYAGGISQHYVVNEARLKMAESRLQDLRAMAQSLHVSTLHNLVGLYEVIDRLDVCLVLVAHLLARKETRWHSFDENADYPKQDDKHFRCFVNSRMENGAIHTFTRPLLKKGETL